MPRHRVLAALVVALALAGCGSKGGGSSSAPSGASSSGGSARATIKSFHYRPATITVKRGTTVTWTNDDTANHTVTAEDMSFDVGNLPQGKSGSHRFDKAGTFRYVCQFHPFMHGTVVVR